MLITYLATGAFAGLMSGLLGIGGGIIVVPALAAIFLKNAAIPHDLYMKMAIGTSLAIMIITLSAGVYIHHQRDSVNWKMVKSVLPGLMLGVILGVILVHFLPSAYLNIFFSIFLFFIGVRLLFRKTDESIEIVARTFSKKFLLGCASLIGVLSSVLGAGGGTMWVPFFIYARLKMHEAIGTSIACGIVAAIVATGCFVVSGFFSTEDIPVWSTSYIYWPAFVGVASTSVIFAPLGAVLAHRLPTQLLRNIFAFFLILTAISMVLFTE